MKKATFEKSVDILVKAYLNDTLNPASCLHCAVGNLIQSYCGVRPVVQEFYTIKEGIFVYAWYSMVHERTPRTHPHIDEMGYSPGDVLMIEEAFMDNVKSNDTFNGQAGCGDAVRRNTRHKMKSTRIKTSYTSCPRQK